MLIARPQLKRSVRPSVVPISLKESFNKTKMSANVKVLEQYVNYAPPVGVHRSVRLLLRYVPEQHLIGLHKIVLTNSETVKKEIRGKITSEKRRFRPAE